MIISKLILLQICCYLVNVFAQDCRDSPDGNNCEGGNIIVNLNGPNKGNICFNCIENDLNAIGQIGHSDNGDEQEKNPSGNTGQIIDNGFGNILPPANPILPGLHRPSLYRQLLEILQVTGQKMFNQQPDLIFLSYPAHLRPALAALYNYFDRGFQPKLELINGQLQHPKFPAYIQNAIRALYDYINSKSQNKWDWHGEKQRQRENFLKYAELLSAFFIRSNRKYRKQLELKNDQIQRRQLRLIVALLQYNIHQTYRPQWGQNIGLHQNFINYLKSALAILFDYFNRRDSSLDSSSNIGTTNPQREPETAFNIVIKLMQKVFNLKGLRPYPSNPFPHPRVEPSQNTPQDQIDNESASSINNIVTMEENPSISSPLILYGRNAKNASLSLDSSPNLESSSMADEISSHNRDHLSEKFSGSSSISGSESIPTLTDGQSHNDLTSNHLIIESLRSIPSKEAKYASSIQHSIQFPTFRYPTAGNPSGSLQNLDKSDDHLSKIQYRSNESVLPRNKKLDSDIPSSTN